MVSQTPLNAVGPGSLPRRDLVAIFAFLNRRTETVAAERTPFENAEGVLQQLAAAARMQ